MSFSTRLSEDGQVILALCSTLGIAADGPVPLKLSEWNELARKINESPLRRPGALAGLGADQLESALPIVKDQAERLAQLLGRAGVLSLELEGLFARGIWVTTRVDESYPAKLRDTLKSHAPSILFGAGNSTLLAQKAVAVVGSRDIDEKGIEFAKQIGVKAVKAGMTVVSGGARGTDRLAMEGALEAGGRAVGVLADSLEKTIRQPDVRDLILDDRLTLITPYAPTAGFSVGAAMGRNKLIYGLADFAVVVSSDHLNGGTWAGAVEALKAGWRPVLVRDGDGVPKGNVELQKLGAVALTLEDVSGTGQLEQILRERLPLKATEQDLFAVMPG